MLPVAAIWREADRGVKPLRPLGERGEEATMDQLEDALTRGQKPSAAVVERALSSSARTSRIFCRRCRSAPRRPSPRPPACSPSAAAQEAKLLAELLTQQRRRIEQAEAGFDDRQTELDFKEEQERRQRRADRKAWLERLERIDRELETEPPVSRKATRSRPEGSSL